MDPSDETALLAAAAGGDTEALGALLAAQYDRCFAVCRRILSQRDDALDATQEAMIAIARGVAGFDGRSSFSTWCYRVATNAALDELRRRRRRPVLLRAERDGAAGQPYAGSAAGDPVAARVTDRLGVEEVLAALPEEQRVAVVLRDIADLDYAAIASVLGVPIGTVRSRIARGRTAIANALGACRAASVPGGVVAAASREGGNFPVTDDVEAGEEPS